MIVCKCRHKYIYRIYHVSTIPWVIVIVCVCVFVCFFECIVSGYLHLRVVGDEMTDDWKHG